MSITKTLNYIFVILLFSTAVFSQKKLETIYIDFNSLKGDTKYSSENEIHFKLRQNDSVKIATQHMLLFLYNSKKSSRKICLSEVEGKLIDGIDAINKVENYLKTFSHLRFRTPYYYNNYFNKIYLYERIDTKKGNLYEVKWLWGIE